MSHGGMAEMWSKQRFVQWYNSLYALVCHSSVDVSCHLARFFDRQSAELCLSRIRAHLIFAFFYVKYIIMYKHKQRAECSAASMFYNKVNSCQ